MALPCYCECRSRVLHSTSVDTRGQEEPPIIAWQVWEFHFHTKAWQHTGREGYECLIAALHVTCTDASVWEYGLPHYNCCKSWLSTRPPLIPHQHGGRGIPHHSWVMLEVEAPYSTFSDSTVAGMGVQDIQVPVTAGQGWKSRFSIWSLLAWMGVVSSPSMAVGWRGVVIV